MNTKMGAVIVCVDDMEGSIRLYRDILGLPCRKTGKRWTEFDAGGFTFALHIQDAGGREKASGVVVLCIEVPDLDATCQTLRSNGYPVDGPEELRNLGRLATFRDPDDVAVSLSQVTR